MKLNITQIPTGSELVRVLIGEGPAYDRMIVVTELAGGRTLYLAGWTGRPLSPSQWRAALREHYPDAREVLFHRVNSAGEYRLSLLTFYRGES